MTNINPFYSAKATPEALNKMQSIREAFKTLSDVLESLTPTEKLNVGLREMALAKTNLEQSSMWAIKSLSHYNVVSETASSPSICPVDPAEASQCDSCQ